MADNRRANKILFISEALSAPFDEGIKNVAFSIHKQLELKTAAVSITNDVNDTDGLNIEKIPLNKLFYSGGLKTYLKDYSPDVILYLPEASVTFNSFVRAKVLKMMSSSSKVVMLGVKHIEYSGNQKKLIKKILRPDLLLLLGRFEIDFFVNAGMKVKVLPPAVDSDKFSEATEEEKSSIRAEFNIPDDKTVVTHVGHIRSTRNVESLLEVQRIEGVQVVIVGSTSTVVENEIKERLEREGVRVIDKTVPDISKIYKMSDIYVFPVMNRIACIDMPLSVLEASACNLPVITTRFGGLAEHFKEDEGFRYYGLVDELVASVRDMMDMDRTKISNINKVRALSWSRFTEEIIDACGEIV